MPADDPLLDTLRTTFGHPGFRPGQEDAARAAVEGRDALVVMPTGAGKSLTYQLPALHGEELALVVSPLVSLMRDQVDQLNARVAAAHERHRVAGDHDPGLDEPAPVRAGMLSGQQDPATNHQVLDRAIRGELRLLYVAPERFGSAAFLERIRHARIGLFVVDEAHCVSQWGHDFRPDYFRLADAARWLGARSILAATATATPQVARDIQHRLRLRTPVVVRTGFDRPNLSFVVRRCAGQVERRGRLLAALRADDALPAIVYAGTRDNAERLAADLSAQLGVEAIAYHAGLDRTRRDEAQRRFMSGEVPIVCATNAFGMGVDKSDVRTVVHDSAPPSVEAWYQEAGRAGRDGAPARALLLADGRDKGLHRYFIERSEVDDPTLDRIAGAIHAAATEGRFDLAVRELGTDGETARAVFGHLTQAGMVQPAPGPPDRLRGRLLGDYDARVRHEVQSLSREAQQKRWAQYRALWQLVESETCRREQVLAHFGDEAGVDEDRLVVPCCDACVPLLLPEPDGAVGAGTGGRSRRGARARALTSEERRAVDRAILEVVRDAHPPVGRTRAVEVLRGGRSQRIVEKGYDGLPAYGRFADLRDGEVLARVDALLEAGALATSGGRYPTLVVVDDGQLDLRDVA
ncbi:ATP-dependent DNA helicase RecQ [Patulibacter brassicae]|jgi:ATP-dependent DNA helicase RecQ|uniref:ATP-dependent DNA helicase RecQ n=1 Tax=Patulibacter brassicae TaxID=1705717 RepID=A0ABU4VJ53_9ACTN|nr:ATP-dependent DNA helicase RecQ [Patulibacter brassicae]MDX8151828.1 ATP-dependent DNA helicase RecQ [Patulibacter brassicae]